MRRVRIAGKHPYRPRVSEFTRTFWDGLRDGRFVTTRGLTTGALTFPPKPLSPADWQEVVEWVEIPQTGILYSYTVIHAAPDAFAADVPYTICIVDLDAGLRVATRYHGQRPPRIDMRIDIVVVQYDDFCTFGASPSFEELLTPLQTSGSMDEPLR